MWKKTLEPAASTFEKLYKNIDGYMISSNARKGINDSNLVYGEVVFDSFAAILSIVDPKPGEVFYDMGSGTGKAVVEAALLYDLKRSVGIELLGPLSQAAEEVKQRLAKDEDQGLRDKSKIIEFYNDNFLQHDISDAGVVFVNATSFFEDTWNNTVNKLMETKPGCRIILCTKKLSPPHFELVKATMAQMSWGDNSINIFRRV